MFSVRAPAERKIGQHHQLSISSDHAPETNDSALFQFMRLSAKELPGSIILVVRDAQDRVPLVQDMAAGIAGGVL